MNLSEKSPSQQSTNQSFCFRDIGAEDLTNELYIPDKAERVDFSRNQVQHEEVNQIKSNESNHL